MRKSELKHRTRRSSRWPMLRAFAAGSVMFGTWGCSNEPSMPATSGATNWLTCQDATDCAEHANASCSSAGYCVGADGRRIARDAESPTTTAAETTSDDASGSDTETTEACRYAPEFDGQCAALEQNVPRALQCSPSAPPPPVCIPSADHASDELWCCPDNREPDDTAGASETSTSTSSGASTSDESGTRPDTLDATLDCEWLSTERCSEAEACSVGYGQRGTEAGCYAPENVPVGCFDAELACPPAVVVAVDADGVCWRFNSGCLPNGFRVADAEECPAVNASCNQVSTCEVATQCTLIDECCQCLVVTDGEGYVPCPPMACEQTLCAQWNIEASDVRCSGDRCELDEAALPRCLGSGEPLQGCAEQPNCPSGTVPEADAAGCWSGRCVPSNLCSGG